MIKNYKEYMKLEFYIVISYLFKLLDLESTNF